MPAKKKRKKKAKKVKKAATRKSPFCARCEVEDKVQVRMNEGGGRRTHIRSLRRYKYPPDDDDASARHEACTRPHRPRADGAHDAHLDSATPSTAYAPVQFVAAEADARPTASAKRITEKIICEEKKEEEEEGPRKG